MSPHRLPECEQNDLGAQTIIVSRRWMSTLASGAGGCGESLRAPINHCNNRPISRYLQTREHVFAARTTRSVLTHLDSSTFARPLWAKNIKISFIAASLCVSPERARVTLAPAAQQLIATWHFYFIRSLPGILRDTCRWRHYIPREIYYAESTRCRLHPADRDLCMCVHMHRQQCQC